MAEGWRKAVRKLIRETVIGECSHCFHMHCISHWINSEASKGGCPMCRQPFKEKMADAPASSPNTTGAVQTDAT